MLPSPYGDCRQAENYTFHKCTSQCIGTFVLSKCKCRVPEMEGIHLRNMFDRFSLLQFYLLLHFSVYFLFASVIISGAYRVKQL